ncbi:Muniscin C-terminal mu homology domain-containing protein [Linnemannia elongata]|nr:Muniscin C-terminal mu homology domain-containing protein [Linnemannia elongata]
MGYAEAFLTERPQDGLDAVQSRLRKGRLLHEQLANYYKERAHIEDMYAKSITKAFQKHFVTDPQALGTFTAPWEKLNAETVELATLHGQYSLRISNEIERPMRDFAKNHPEWQNIALAESNCNRIAKEFDEKQLKVTKYTKAVEKVSGKKAEVAEQKLMEYTKQLDSTRTAWRLEGPVILNKYQNLDQSRLDHMKQMLAVFEALQTETALQIAELSGRTSSSAAEFDSTMDMELFASEMSINLNALEPHDGASIVSGISHPSNGDIGSLDGRKTNGAHKRAMTGSSQLSNISYSTERSAAQSKAGSMDQTRPAETLDHARSASSVLGSAIDVPTNHVDAEGFSIPPPDHGPWSDAGGASSVYDDERSETSSFSQAPNKMQMEIKKDTVLESNDEARAALERVSSTLKQSKTVSRRHPGRREVRSMYQSEDTSSAYNSYHSSPLSTAFTPDSSRETLGTPPAMNSPGSRAFFNTSASHLQTSTLTPGMARASTLGLPASSSPVQSQLSHSLPPTPALIVANGSGSSSGLSPIAVLGTGQPLATEPESTGTSINGSSVPTSPISPTHSGALLGAGQPQKWVASVIEKIHVHAQSGEVSKMMVTGEVILNLEGTEMDPEGSVKKALLRLDQLQSLDKHVPNPAYLSPKEGVEGAYWVNLEALSQAMQQNGVGQGHGVVVLKYQVKTTEEDARQRMVPLMIQPAWKCEAHQTSLLINYKANAQCKLSQTQQEGGVQLSEVSFLVPVSGEVTNVQSRPTGVWNSESNKMFWDVDNVTMSSTAPEPHKLLARFEMNPAGGASQPSAAAVKFRVQGQLLSDLLVTLEKEKDTTVAEGEAVEAAVEEVERVAFGSVRLQVQSGRYLATA